MKIMIDLDRVVFDCPSLVYFIGNKIFTKTHLNKKLKYHVVDPQKAKKAINTLFFLKMSHSKNFKQVDNSVEILRKWNDQGFDLNFVSSRPNFKIFQKATIEWFVNNGINFSKLIFTCSNKPLYCKINKFDVIIDDTLENCIGAKRIGITPIWVRTKYNEKVNAPADIFNTCLWKEIDDFVQNLNLVTQNNISEEELERI